MLRTGYIMRRFHAGRSGGVRLLVFESEDAANRFRDVLKDIDPDGVRLETLHAWSWARLRQPGAYVPIGVRPVGRSMDDVRAAGEYRSFVRFRSRGRPFR